MSTPYAAPLAAETGRSAALRSALRRVATAVGTMVAAFRHRRQVMGLLELDERGLRDIGLTRSDVIGALQTPLRFDPSLGLKQVALERELRTLALEGAVRLKRDRAKRWAA